MRTGRPRRLLGAAALVALAALPLSLTLGLTTVASHRGLTSIEVRGTQADVLGVADGRPVTGVAALLGYLTTILVGAGGLIWLTSPLPVSTPALADGRLRRWRARLEGAPPASL